MVVTMRGDKLKGTLLYYLFKSMRELGLDLNLLFRRLSVIASRDVEYISKEFFNGKVDIGNFEQMIKDLSSILKNEELVGEIDISSADSTVTLGVSNCSYLPMAEKAISHGEKSCPLCIISLAVSIPAMVSKGQEFNLTDYETNLDGKKCVLKVTHKV